VKSVRRLVPTAQFSSSAHLSAFSSSSSVVFGGLRLFSCSLHAASSSSSSASHPGDVIDPRVGLKPGDAARATGSALPPGAVASPGTPSSGLLRLSSSGKESVGSRVPGRPRIRSAQTLKTTNWLRLKRLHYVDEEGVEREWESIERVSRHQGVGVDAVAVLPILKREGEPSKLILISQFRPPIGKYCLEMPAGLIDKGEDIESAALRELEEETGYVGRVVRTSPPIFNDPGLSNTSVSLVTVEIDAEDPLNENPKPVPEEGEFIEVVELSLDGDKFYDELDALLEQGLQFDAKLFSFLNGIQYSDWLFSDDHRSLAELLDPDTPDEILDIKADDNLSITITRGGRKKTQVVLEDLTKDLREQQQLLREITQADVDKIEHLLQRTRELMLEREQQKQKEEGKPQLK